MWQAVLFYGTGIKRRPPPDLTLPGVTTVDEYRSWAAQKGDALPLFLRPWWLDAVCGDQRWKVALAKNNGGDLIAALPYFQFYKTGITVIALPFLTPYMGIYIHYPEKQKLTSRYDYEKQVLDDLIDQLPNTPYLQQKFYPALTYGLPFFWKGFRLDWRYTYQLSLQDDEKTIWDQLEGAVRTQLQKTSGQLEIVESKDATAMHELVTMSFRRQHKKMPYSRDAFQRLYDAASDRGVGKIFLAVLPQNQVPVAGIYIVYDRDTVYNLVLGRNHQLDPGGSIHSLLWKAIRDHIGQYRIFDFEGSMLEGPEHVFRSFGSIRVPVLQVTRYRNRLWKAALALAGK